MTSEFPSILGSPGPYHLHDFPYLTRQADAQPVIIHLQEKDPEKIQIGESIQGPWFEVEGRVDTYLFQGGDQARNMVFRPFSKKL